MKQPTPNTDQAIEFLQKIQPTGFWVLTAILPDKGQITTDTFLSTEVEQTKRWIDNFQGERNIYFTLNGVKEKTYSKPTKKDISAVNAFHVDIDLRPMEDHATGRERILSTVRAFKPYPSFIIDSGNGYQPLFMLQEPIPLDGTLEMAEEYEAYNRQLEILLEGDKCFNIDRILRLPGTINLPDTKKQKKGRVPTLATLVEWNEQKYSPTDFIKSPLKIQTALVKEELAGGAEQVQFSGNLAHIYVDELAGRGVVISDYVQMLIVQGHDPDNLEKYPSRSEALFAVVCELVRARATDEIIAGIILNPDNKISESVLDKSRPDRYAAKQIQSAKEEVEDPELRKLNAKHAVISDIGGKCRIISEIFDPSLSRQRISYQSFDDFRNRYCHKKVQIATDKAGDPVFKPLGQWWITHPMRRQYDAIIFAPGREVAGAYNLWQGFACEAIPGDCSLYLEHILKNICSDNTEYYDYLIRWMARCVQQPNCPGEVAVVMRGEMGTGKGVLAKNFGALFGRHFLQVSDPKHLVGSFNLHLQDCVLLFSDEAFWAGDKKHEAVLRSLVTEETLAIEGKGRDLVAAANNTHLIMASNSHWVVPAGSNERRFFVLDVSSDKMQNKPYFSAIRKQMDSGGREALLHFLLNLDISSFEVRDVPKTVALQDQKLHSYSPEESWWYEKLEEGRILKEDEYWKEEVRKSALQDDYINFMTRIGMMRKQSPAVLGKFLGKVFPNGVPKSYQKTTQVKQIDQFGNENYVSKRVYFYQIPALEKLREHWDKYHGGPFKWQEILRKEESLASQDAFS